MSPTFASLQHKGEHKRPSAAAPESANHVVTLRTALGNQALQRVAQSRFKLGAENDPEEQEAERLAGGTYVRPPATVADARPLGSVLGPGKPLPSHLRESLEPRLAADLGGVRVHVDAAAEALAASLQARAFAAGPDIAFAAGEYSPDTVEGRRLIAHEAAHVLQPSAASVLRRQPVSTPAAAGQEVSSETAPAGAERPGLTPEQQRQLLYATTTLRKVEPLSEADRSALNLAIAGSPLVELIKQRAEKEAVVKQKRDELQRMRDAVANPPEHGAPPTQEEVDAAARELDNLTTELDHLGPRIEAELAALGVPNEQELLRLVDERFPRLFVDRAKKIATTELDENQKILDEEANRYGIVACVDPSARQSLIKAARDLVAHDQQIQELQDSVDQVRSSVDQPSGGVLDPEQRGSSYYDLVRRQERLNQAIQDRADLRGRYGLEHPVLLRDDVDLSVLASGNEEQINAMLGGKLDEIARNIAETKDNIQKETLKIWNLNNIVEMTNQDLGIGSNQTLQAAVRRHIQGEQSDEALIKIALAALAFTAGIIATVATGGLALVAGAVMVGVGGYTATKSVRSYLAESAASNIALDPRIADISKKEPELFWLVLDIVGVVADVALVVSVFNEMRLAARALREAEDIAEFQRAARAALAPELADRLVDSAVRRNPQLASKLRRSVRAPESELEQAITPRAGLPAGQSAAEVEAAAAPAVAAAAGRTRGLQSPFMRAMLKRILADDKHPLRFLVDVKAETWLSRTHLSELPTVQAGHLVSFHSGAPEALALEDSFFNQVSNWKGERFGAIFEKSAVEIGGVPVEVRTAEMWESLGVLPEGTVAAAMRHAGWTGP